MTGPGSHSDDLRRQVEAASEVVQRQDFQQRTGSTQRRKGLLGMSLALAALAVTLYFEGHRLATPQPDPVQVRADAVDAVDVVRSLVEAYRDAHGALPERLADLGLPDVGVVYTTAGNSFRVAAPTPQGDSIVYQSPATPATGAAR